MAEVPSAPAAAASSPSPPLQDPKPPSRHQRSSRTQNDFALGSSTILEPLYSDTTEVRSAQFVCLCMEKKRKATCCTHNLETLVAVDSDGHCFHKSKSESYLDVYSSAFCICTPTTEDGGAYTVCTEKKTSIFKHQKSRELPEPRETCEVQNCQHEFCSCYLIDPALVASPMVKEPSSKELNRLHCRAWNESVTGVLCNALTTQITTHPPSTDDHSDNLNWTWSVAAAVPVGALFALLCYIFIAKKGRLWHSSGSQGDSHGAAGDMDVQAEESV